MSPRPLATIEEVAEYLGVTDKTLRRWARLGYGPTPRMVGKQYRYRWDEVEAYVEAQKIPPSEPADEALEPCGCTGI